MAMARRFLIIKPSSFGDIVHLFPALALLKRQFPDAVLDFLVNPEFAPLLEFSPFPVERIILFERRKLSSFRSFFSEFFKLKRELRREEYDMVIDFQGLFRSGMCAALARSDFRVGFANPREAVAAWFYNRKFKVKRTHAVRRNLSLVEQLAGLPETDAEQLPELPVSEKGRADLPPLPEQYMVLFPGTRWESKQFPPEFFAAVVREIKQNIPDLKFAACGGAADIPLADAIGEGVINLAGKTTLPVLFEILRSSCGALGNDSGPLHAAAALNIPVFGLYGPTEPGFTGPWGSKTTVFQRRDLSCIGCLKRNCPLEKCLCHELDVKEIAAFICEKIERR